MSLTLGAVEEALFQAIAALAPVAAAGTPGVPAGPAQNAENGAAIRYIGRWVGEPSRNTPITDYFRAAVFKETTQRCPAILLGFEGEVTEAPTNTVRTLSGSTETVGVSTWSILCVVNDARTTRLIMHGTPAGTTPTMGVYDLLALVEPVVVNLRIDGLYRAQPVRFLDSRALLIAPGELYVLQLRVTARRVLSAAEVTAPNGFLTFEANVNAYPSGLTGDFASNPLSAVTAYPGGLAPPLDYPPLRALLARFDIAAVNGVDRDGVALPPPGDYYNPSATLNPVAEWRDRHARRWLLAQAEADRQPTYDRTAPTRVSFANNLTLAGPIPWLPIGAEARAVAVVFHNATDTGQTRQILVGWGAATQAARFALTIKVGTTLGIALDAGGTLTLQTAANPVTAGGTWLVIARYTAAGTLAVRALDTGIVDLSATLAATTIATTLTDLTFGGGLSAGLIEVLVYRDDLTTQEETDLITYARTVHGINP